MIRAGCRFFAAVCFFILAAESMQADSYVILESGEDKGLLQQEQTILKEQVESDRILKQLFQKFSLKPTVKEIGKNYFLWLGPLKNDRSVAALFYMLKKKLSRCIHRAPYRRHG